MVLDPCVAAGDPIIRGRERTLPSFCYPLPLSFSPSPLLVLLLHRKSTRRPASKKRDSFVLRKRRSALALSPLSHATRRSLSLSRCQQRLTSDSHLSPSADDDDSRGDSSADSVVCSVNRQLLIHPSSGKSPSVLRRRKDKGNLFPLYYIYYIVRRVGGIAFYTGEQLLGEKGKR